MVKYSVIIISFESFSETTELLLNSLLSSKSKYNAEIILLDNGSSVETADQLKQIKDMDERLKVIFNPDNLGFAGGNNKAFGKSSGEIAIFLNSDTITSFYALDRLVDEMENNHIRILGPISNEVSGVQKIKIFSNDVNQILKEGEFINNSDISLEPFETDCLSFFCIAIKRRVYEELNGLDEEYKMGYYEDTDFCFRARKLGIPLHCSEKVFIYHKGEGSFGKTSIESQINHNKKRFKKIHGGFKSRKARVENLERIKFYIKQLKAGKMSPVIDFLYSRRTSMIYQSRPRNWVKKVQYFFNYLAIIFKD